MEFKAVNNIETVDKLNFDLHTEVIDWSEMQDLQLLFLNLVFHILTHLKVMLLLLCINLLKDMELNIFLLVLTTQPNVLETLLNGCTSNLINSIEGYS